MSEIVKPDVQELKSELAASDAAALASFEAPVAPVAPVEPVVPTAAPEPPAAPPAAPEGTPVVVPVVPEAPKQPEDAIAPKPHARQETHQGFDALKGIIGTERAAKEKALADLAELKAQKEKLETEYKGKILTPEKEKEYKELQELRREQQLESDPAFQEEWGGKLKQADGRVMGILKSCNISDSMAKFITDNGGVIAMSISQKSMPDGKYGDKTQQEFIEEVIAKSLGSAVQERRFLDAVAQGITIKEDMTREIEESKASVSEKQQKRQQDAAEKFNKAVMDTRSQFADFSNKLELPKDATPDQKKKIEKHNALVDKAEQAFNDFRDNGSRDPAKVGEALARASASFILTELLLDKDVEIANLKETIKGHEERFAKIKQSGSTGAQTSAPPPGSQIPNTGTTPTDTEALNSYFKKAV